MAPQSTRQAAQLVSLEGSGALPDPSVAPFKEGESMDEVTIVSCGLEGEEASGSGGLDSVTTSVSATSKVTFLDTLRKGALLSMVNLERTTVREVASTIRN